MCLTKLDKIELPIGEIPAWKLFGTDADTGELECVFFPEYKIGLNKWLEADEAGTVTVIEQHKRSCYRLGFHCFKTYEGALRFKTEDGPTHSGLDRSWVSIRKVKIRNLLASGTQDGVECWVAKEMIVEERGKAE